MIGIAAGENVVCYFKIDIDYCCANSEKVRTDSATSLRFYPVPWCCVSIESTLITLFYQPSLAIERLSQSKAPLRAGR